MVTRQELEEAEALAREKQKQPIPQRRYGSGVTKEQQQQVISEREQATENLVKINEAKRQLEEYDRQRTEANSLEYDRQRGLKVATSSDPRAVFSLENERQREFYRAYKSQRKEAKLKALYRKEGVKPVYRNGQIVGYIDLKKNQSVGPEQLVNLSQEDLTRYENAGLIELKATSDAESKNAREQLLEKVLPNQSVNRPLTKKEQAIKIYNEVNNYLKREVTSRVSSENIEKFSNVASKSGVGYSLVGVGNYGVGGSEGRQVSQTITQSNLQDIREKPLKNVLLFGGGYAVGVGIKGTSAGLNYIPKAVPYVEKVLVAGGGLVAIQYSKSIIKEVTGYKFISIVEKPVKVEDVSLDIAIRRASIEAKDLALFGAGVYGGTKSFDYASDVLRTFGKQKLPQESVIAPEYFQGQKYPKIKRGQTAGELKAEFFQPSLPGEKAGVPRMFTASPSSFKTSTTVQAGSSELAGLYGSAKVSPSFLKVSSETKTIGFKDFLKSSNPTVLRTELAGLDYVPGVKGSQKNIRPLDAELKKFFINEAELGKGYIPFIKTEKEAVLPVGSSIKITEKNFYFEFNNRKVPIFQSVTELEIKNLPKGTKVMDVEAFYNKYYSSAGSSVYNPLSFLGYSSLKSSSSSPKSINSALKSYNRYGRSSVSPLKSAGRYGGSPRSPPVKIISTPYSYSRGSSRINPPVPPPYSPPPSIPNPPKRPPTIIKLPGFKGGVEEQTGTGFRTFLIKNRKKVYLPGIRSKGEALRYGEKRTSSTLRATFGVTPTNVKVKVPSVPNYNPSTKIYRNYKINQGRRVPLVDTYIQRRGKRLAFGSEVAEIQRARRKRR